MVRHWRSYLLLAITAAALVVAVLAIRQLGGSGARPGVAPAPVAVGQATPAPTLDPEEQRQLTAAVTQIVGGSRPRAKAKKRRAKRAARATEPTRSDRRRFSEADIRRATGHATAIAVFCQRRAQKRAPSPEEDLAALAAELELPQMVRKDPDTAYLWPDRDGDLTVRLTMRQTVGQVRDKVASAGCDAGLENDLTTVLEALPR